MRRYLLLFACISGFTNGFTQGTAILEDEPNYAQFMAQGGIGLEIDFNARLEVPLIFGLHYDLKGLPIEFDASFLFSILSERKKSFYPNNEFENYNSFEVGGVYNFFDNAKVKNIAVVVDRDTKFRNSRRPIHVTTYMWSEGMVRKRFGLRMGLYRYAQSLMATDAEGNSIVIPDGTTFPTEESILNNATSFEEVNFFTAERHLAVYAGVCFHRSTGLEVDAKGFGKRNAMRNQFFYADVFVDVASDIQKLSYQGELYDVKNATSGLDLNKVGYRFGTKIVAKALYISLEIGQRPQYLKSQLYSRIALGYSFNSIL